MSLYLCFFFGVSLLCFVRQRAIHTVSGLQTETWSITALVCGAWDCNGGAPLCVQKQHCSTLNVSTKYETSRVSEADNVY